MSTASPVPETYQLDGERALATMRHAKVSLLARDAGARLRWADGFSHSRAMAFQIVLTLIPGAIVVVALASELRWDGLTASIINLSHSFAPGQAGELFDSAFGQGSKVGQASSGVAALVFGGLAFVIAGTTAYGQIERTANRIYGVEADRPTLRKYGLALAMMLTSGILTVAGLATISLGERWGRDWNRFSVDDIWGVARWPIGLGFLTLAIALIFKLSPRRRQPNVAWLAVGAGISVAGILVVSLALHLYLHASKGFGDTYGPLAGVIGVLLWAYLSSIVMFYGLAFAAQLEAFRAGAAEPRSVAKVRQSDPSSHPTPLPDDDVANAPDVALAGRVDGRVTTPV
jgi:YihY family inner membrane protein